MSGSQIKSGCKRFGDHGKPPVSINVNGAIAFRLDQTFKRSKHVLILMSIGINERTSFLMTLAFRAFQIFH
jgi:hypothetical protein